MPSYDYFEDYLIKFELYVKVLHLNRIVYGVYKMFGDIGGLNDLLVIVLLSTVGHFSESFKLTLLVANLFLEPLKKN